MVDVLLVEDNDADARLLQDTLEGASAIFSLSVAGRLETALRLLEMRRFDVVLLDPGLPDSQGVDGLIALRRAAPRVPVVVVTGHAEDQVGIESLKLGAQDYLSKNLFPAENGELVSRAIRYAIERQLLLNALQELQDRERLTQAFDELDDLDRRPSTRLAGIAYDGQAVEQALPDTFRLLSKRYGELVDASEREAGFKPSAELHGAVEDLVGQLGFLRAGPADVVAMHTAALRELYLARRRPMTPIALDASRALLIKTMGQLVAFYRARALGIRAAPVQAPKDRS